MSFTIKHNKKTGQRTFFYKGDLEETIQKAEKELKNRRDSQKAEYLRWQYQKAKKEYETYERRIDDLEAFIQIAKEHLKKGESNETD